MNKIILLYISNDIQIYTIKEQNYWLIEFVTMKRIPDIPETFAEKGTGIMIFH